MAEREEEIVCPVKTDWLKKWSEQIPKPLWGKVAPFIEKCLQKAETKTEEKK